MVTFYSFTQPRTQEKYPGYEVELHSNRNHKIRMFHLCELYIAINVINGILKSACGNSTGLVRGISLVGQNLTISLGEGEIQTGIIHWIYPDC